MRINPYFVLIFLSFGLNCQAIEKIKFNFKNKALVDVVEFYSKKSNTSFLMTEKTDSKVSIFNPEKITLDEALAQIARLLKQDGYSLVKMNETLSIVKAKNAQRDNIPVYQQLPERIYDHIATLVVSLPKNRAKKILKEFPILLSKDGEIQAFENKLYITDFYSNLLRVEKLLKDVN